MGNFNRDRKSRGRRNFGGDRENRPTFRAVCASCGRDCDLPFKPTGDRPVYCRDCFSKNGNNNSRERDDRRSNFSKDARPQTASNEQFRVISSKLDQILKLLKANEIAPVEEKSEETTEAPEEEVVVKKKKTVKKISETPVEVLPENPSEVVMEAPSENSAETSVE